MKQWIYIGLVLVLAPLCSLAQVPYQVERDASFRLKKNELKSITLSMDSGMSAKFYVESNTLLSFTIYDPNGQVLNEDMTLGSSITSQFGARLSGLYQIDFQNASRFLANRVRYTVSYEKFKGIPARAKTDVRISKEGQETLLDVGYQISRKTPKTYPFVLEEGDKLIISLTPLGNESSYMEVTNDIGELVYGQFPSPKMTKTSIPIYVPGTYTVNLNWNKLFRGKELVQMEKWSPARYAAIPDTSTKIVIEYDTISSVFLDTNVFLGAQRDIVHAQKYAQEIMFPVEDSTIFWGLIYGFGSGFKQEMEKLKPLLEGDALAAGVNDLLSGQRAGYIKRLPGPGRAKVEVEASMRIDDELKKNVNGNFAWIDSTKGYFQIIFENTSESSGQLVYLNVVQFRHVAK